MDLSLWDAGSRVRTKKMYYAVVSTMGNSVKASQEGWEACRLLFYQHLLYLSWCPGVAWTGKYWYLGQRWSQSAIKILATYTFTAIKSFYRSLLNIWHRNVKFAFLSPRSMASIKGLCSGCLIDCQQDLHWCPLPRIITLMVRAQENCSKNRIGLTRHMHGTSIDLSCPLLARP